jgi:hypothetical protein
MPRWLKVGVLDRRHGEGRQALMMRPTARLIEEKKPSEATNQRSPAESTRRSPPKLIPVRSRLAGDRLSGSSVFGHRADAAKIAGCELSIKPQGTRQERPRKVRTKIL